MVNAVAFNAPPAQAAQRTLSASDAAWTTSRHPSTVQSQGYLSATNTEDRSYVKFDGRGLKGETVTSAKLVLRVVQTTASAPGIRVHTSSNSWKSSTLTAKNAPALQTGVVGRAEKAAEAATTVEVPVEISAVSTTGDFSFRLSYEQRFIQLKFARSGANAPSLVVTTEKRQTSPSPGVASTLAATETAWTTGRKPNSVQSQGYLSATNTEDRTYLRFDGSSLKGRIVTSAKLVLRVTRSTTTQPGVLVHPASNSWRSATLTQSNSPALQQTVVGRGTTSPTTATTIEVPLDAAAIVTTGPFSLRLSYSQRYIQFQFLRSGANAPRLVVTTTTPPPASSQPTPTPSPTPTARPTPTASPTTPAVPKPEPTATAKPRLTPTVTPTPAGRSTSDGPLVFAHYFAPYPLSLDNQPAATDYYTRNYLTPEGEGGKYAQAGGLLRDRPLPVDVSSNSDWQIRNLVTEIRQAQAAGIDGWTLNLLSTEGVQWDRTVNVLKAADRVGDFPIIPMVDASAGLGKKSPAELASLLNQLLSHTSTAKIADKYLLSSFYAEKQSVSWWSDTIRILQTTYKRPITFQAVFLDASADSMKAFAGIADHYGNWGMRTVRNIVSSTPDYVARAATYGKTWMSPVAPQDSRPRSFTYAEPNNTEAFRAQWEKAISERPAFIQIVSWNDFSENTHVSPSLHHGNAYLAITKFYTQWLKTGVAPAITSDQLVVTHRTQFVDAKPSYDHRLSTPTLGGEKQEPRDAVEALVWLTSPAVVEVTAGGKKTTFQAPGGLSAYTVPLQYGTVSARIIRAGSVTVAVTSPDQVVRTPRVQDMSYHATSSW